MIGKEKQLYEQVLVYANDYFRWDDRPLFSVEVDDRLNALPKTKRESLLADLIEKNEELIQQQPDNIHFILQNRNKTIQKRIEQSIEKIGFNKINTEFSAMEKTLARFQELSGEISSHLKKFDSDLKKYYNEEDHLRREKFPESKTVKSGIISVVGLFQKKMEKELPVLKKEYKEIEDFLSENSDSIFESMKISIENSGKEINKPQDEKVETEKGLRYINPMNVLIGQIKRYNHDIQMKLTEKNESVRKYFTSEVFLMLLTSKEILRMQRLIIAMDKRDILLKKLEVISGNSGTQVQNTALTELNPTKKKKAKESTRQKLSWMGDRDILEKIFSKLASHSFEVRGKKVLEASKSEITKTINNNFDFSAKATDVEAVESTHKLLYNGEIAPLLRLLYYLSIKKLKNGSFLLDAPSDAILSFVHNNFIWHNKEEKADQPIESKTLSDTWGRIEGKYKYDFAKLLADENKPQKKKNSVLKIVSAELSTI